VLHLGEVTEGVVSSQEKVLTVVNKSRRFDIARNHTATHLLHSALKNILGNHVEQSGSLVTQDRLRFDFTHFEAISHEDLKKVEKLVNEKIMDDLEVNTVETSLEEARKMGATALFGEKYGAFVRVVKAGDFSMEFCGGTHIHNTASIGLFKIVSEVGVAAGVRRIEAVTGNGALKYVENLEDTIKETAAVLKTPLKDITRRAESIIMELKEKEKEIDNMKAKMAEGALDDILNSVKDIKGIKVVTANLELDVDALRNLGDKLRDKLGKSVIVLSSLKDEKITFISMASKDAVSAGAHAGNIVREVAKIAGGSGGGRPDMAQAGGKNKEKVSEALASVEKILENMIK
jgi:alanyl-tRNA synthetase